MSLDEAAIREWVHRVAHGMADRRAFLQYMMGLGLSGPFLSNLLATYAPAQAQTVQPGAGFVPTKRGGGGKLRLLWWQAPTILNAHLASGGKDFDASRVVYEPLAAFDPDANFVPILAADIPSLDNGGLAQDGRSVTWKLKPGVVWHDGKPFTADDVVFTWEFAADSATGATTTGSYTTIDHIDKLDAHTVKVVFKEPTAFWYDAFFGHRGHILPKHLFAQYKGQEARNAPYNLKPVGTVALHYTVGRCTCKKNGGPDILLLGMFPNNARRSVMNPATVFCPNLACPARGQIGQGTLRIHSCKDQRFMCTECHKTFSATKGTALYRLRTPAETVRLVMTLMAHGGPLPASVVAFGDDERTVAGWLARAGVQGQAGQAHLVEYPHDLGQGQADAIRVKK